MRYVELTGRLLLALVFLAAVVGKLRSRAAFAGFVGSVEAFGLLPRRRVRPVAGLAVAVEAAVVPLLAVPAAAPAGYAAAAALLAVLTGAILAALRRGRRPACHCFGTAGAPIGPRHVVRNVLLFLVAAAGLAASPMAGAGPPAGAAGRLLALAAAAPLAALVVRLDDLAALFAPAPSAPARPPYR
ncbi:MauE/DoxX family redox-associated membrane protein [Plantactinospora siamensis]|uniref:MauE/DoxX family redox-associated membrane protein n=1 Tax=Plantactinospora siamensis TaxID=555372 RepID=A0ABV6P1C6_9ACTN